MSNLKIQMPKLHEAGAGRKTGRGPVIGADQTTTAATPMPAQVAANDTAMPAPGDTSFERAKSAADRMKNLQRVSSLELVLQVERQLRQTRTVRDFSLLVANETRKLSNARQIIVLSTAGLIGKWRVEAVSSMASVSQSSPFVHWITDIARSVCAHHGASAAYAFELPTHCEGHEKDAEDYPFRYALWQPLTDRDGRMMGAILQLRDSAWDEAGQVVNDRLAECFAHHLELLRAPKTGLAKLNPFSWKRRGLVAACLAVSALFALLIPVPMTTLAPIEVVAREPQIVAAPIDGVVDRIAVAPNATVKAGDLLVQLEDTKLRNGLTIAEQKVEVARARYQRASQAAFSDPAARREVTVAKAEYDLARSERDYARDLLAQTQVRASSGGVAIYGNPDEWKGRPVSMGERVLQIAQPGDVAFRIDLPVADAIVLKPDARIRAFLDARPLDAIDGAITEVSYQAEANTTQQLVYRVRADLGTDEALRPRIGSRGTAQLYGQDVSLGFYLFRRPISAFRQMLGF